MTDNIMLQMFKNIENENKKKKEEAKNRIAAEKLKKFLERIEEILKSSVVITKDADNGIDERIVYIKVILETEEVLNKRTKKYLEKLLKRRSVKQNSELLNNLCKMASSKALRERKDSYAACSKIRS